MTNYARIEDEGAEELIRRIIRDSAALTNRCLGNIRPDTQKRIIELLNAKQANITVVVQLTPTPEVHGLLTFADPKEQTVELFASTIDPASLEKVLH